MPSAEVKRTIVVGVLPDHPLWVVQVAGEYAQAFGAELVCVSVDPARYAFQDLPDGSLMTAPIDPDLLAGGPAFGEALIEVADEVDALMIVVGAGRRGLRRAVRSMVNGSVAGRLSHRQYRPVVVVPTAPDTAPEPAEGQPSEH